MSHLTEEDESELERLFISVPGSAPMLRVFKTLDTRPHRVTRHRAEAWTEGIDTYREGWREGSCRHIIPANPYEEAS